MSIESFLQEYEELQLEKSREANKQEMPELKSEELVEEFLQKFTEYLNEYALPIFKQVKEELEDHFHVKIETIKKKEPFNFRQLQMILLPREKNSLFLMEVKLKGFAESQKVELVGAALDGSGMYKVAFTAALPELKEKNLPLEMENLLRYFFLEVRSKQSE